MKAKTQAQLDASARWRERNREASRLRAAKWRAENRDRHKARLATWAGDNPEKAAAAMAVRQAVYEGRLTKSPCHVCGETKTEGHHASYAKDAWLDVVWLCKKHHREIHAKPKAVRVALPVTELRWTPALLGEAAAMRNEGTPWQAVADRYGVSQRRIRDALAASGIPIVSYSRWGLRK